jgi:hypothetical protein
MGGEQNLMKNPAASLGGISATLEQATGNAIACWFKPIFELEGFELALVSH